MACRRRTGIRVGFSAANWRLCLEATPPLLCSMVMLTAACFGQTAPNERPFAASKAEVDRALRSMQAAGGGRLPTLEGFIAEQSLPTDHLQRPHYTYSLDVLPKPSGSLVRVRAHITAWFAAPRLGSPATASSRRMADWKRICSNAWKTGLGKSPVARPQRMFKRCRLNLLSESLFAVPRPGAVSLPSRSSADSSTSDSSTPVQHLEATIPLVMFRRCANKRRTGRSFAQSDPPDRSGRGEEPEDSGVFAPIRARRGLVPGRCSG